MDKQGALDKDIAELQLEVGSPDLRHRVDHYEALISQLQDKLQHGWPEGQQERNGLYDLIYKGQVDKAEEDQNEQHEKRLNADNPDHSVNFVDRAGFGFAATLTGFGPACTTKSQHSPYAKGPPDALAPGKGKHDNLSVAGCHAATAPAQPVSS